MTPRTPHRVDCLRISVTDQCDLRCLYCMPEGLPAFPLECGGLTPLSVAPAGRGNNSFVEGGAGPDRAQVAIEPAFSARQAAPEESGVEPPQSKLEDIAVLVRFLVERFGLRTARLTGGEPLLRSDIVEMVARLAATGVPDLALTTNAQRLADFAAPLREAGLQRVNISLDSLDPARYARLTRGGQLARTLAGIEAARAAGFRAVKLNTVVLRGENEAEVCDLLEFALARGLEIRFLELMAIGCAAPHHARWFMSSEEVIERLKRRWRLTPLKAAEKRTARTTKTARTTGTEETNTTAVCFVAPSTLAPLPSFSSFFPALERTYAVNGGAGRVGFISPETRPFCASCRRLRLTSDGTLLGCLMHSDGPNVLPYLRARTQFDFEALGEAVQSALRSKPAVRERYSPRLMAAIGG